MRQRPAIFNSFQSRLVIGFVLTAFIPMLLVIILSYTNTVRIVRENMHTSHQQSLQQTHGTVELWLTAYEDLLYQIYTNDTVISLTNALNQANDAFVKKELKSILQSYFYAKEYIRTITVVSSGGSVVFYDQFTTSVLSNSWLDSYPMSIDTIYEQACSRDDALVLPSHYATTFGTSDVYMFHLAHRIVDYQDFRQDIGIVIVSVDEQLLRDLCVIPGDTPVDALRDFSFILTEDGILLSYIDRKYIGTRILQKYPSDGDEAALTAFVERTRGVMSDSVVLLSSDAGKYNWRTISAWSIQDTTQALANQRLMFLPLAGVACLLVVLLTLLLGKRLTKSIRVVSCGIRATKGGNLSSRVPIHADMPTEIQTIAIIFNEMLTDLQQSIDNERQTAELQKNAEIRALELQIKPHFLYNVLDSINWLAIDHDEFEISEAISALAKILRYGINNSNQLVPLREEVAWLEQYMSLQKIRFRNTFDFSIDMRPGTEDYPVHKLLFQPLVENAIVHGFDGVKGDWVLDIRLDMQDERLRIDIIDNGRGMDRHTIACHFTPSTTKSCASDHVGIRNVLHRIALYYGDTATVDVHSQLGEGTHITILLPTQEKEDVP